MATPRDDETNDRGRSSACGICGARSAADQRYCLECGARRGPLPPAVAARLAALRDPKRGGKARHQEKGAPVESRPSPDWMPTPRAAAAAVMAMLALGVLLGSATGQVAQSAGLSSIVLEVAASSPPLQRPIAAATAAAPAAAAAATPLPPATTSSLPALAPPPAEPAPEPAPVAPLPPEFPEAETLPPVEHVFLIVLGENGFDEAFGEASPAPYLAKTLRDKGELISNYYAVTKGDLANQIALLSGQGPTPETAANCPTYADIAPGTISPEGQVEGSGCVYPAATSTLPGQLAERDLSWRAYVEDVGNGVAAGLAPTCRRPALGAADANQAPLPEDAYLTWRNPFVYFHSLLDDGECDENDVGLDRLAADLAKTETTPALSYIVPNACHDGGELPCAPDQPTGPAEAEAFLRTVVPEIEASAAYEEGGLIAIVSSQAPQAGPNADSSACCVGPEYPNLPPEPSPEPSTGPVKALGGGGKVGALLISPFVEPGSVEEAGYFNHYSLLLTIEELFGLEKLGYANELALVPFGETVFGPAEEDSGAGTKPSPPGGSGRASAGPPHVGKVERTAVAGG